MLSQRRFDRSECTGLVQMRGSPRVSRSTWRVDDVTFPRRLLTVELKALMNVSCDARREEPLPWKKDITSNVSQRRCVCRLELL